jgi:hypothetical protein
MTVQFQGEAIEVPEGYEAFTVAVLQCDIRIAAVGLEPETDPGEFFVNFHSAEDCEEFADLIVACADKELIDKLFAKDGSLSGSFGIEMTNDEDDYRTFTVMEMCLPIALRDDLTKLFEATKKIVEAEVSYCDSNGRRSNGSIPEETVPKSEWDGHIFAAVPGVDHLRPGSLVKLSFHASKPAHIVERLWVKVVSLDDDELTGTVDVHPAALTNLHRGDTVKFNRFQILRVMPPKKQAEMRNMALN